MQWYTPAYGYAIVVCAFDAMGRGVSRERDDEGLRGSGRRRCVGAVSPYRRAHAGCSGGVDCEGLIIYAFCATDVCRQRGGGDNCLPSGRLVRTPPVFGISSSGADAAPRGDHLVANHAGRLFDGFEETKKGRTK
jgi:hypothetical protein